MADTLKWMRFLPSKGVKVKCIEFHTIHPWLAIADKANNVSVWDFESQQVPIIISDLLFPSYSLERHTVTTLT